MPPKLSLAILAGLFSLWTLPAFAESPLAATPLAVNQRVDPGEVLRASELINRARQVLSGCDHAALSASHASAPDARTTRSFTSTRNAEPRAPQRPQMRADARLAQAAFAHAASMAERGYFSHTGLDGRTAGARVADTGYRWGAVGENLAAGHRTIDEAVAGWILSPSHCAVLLDARFSEFGIARVESPDPSDRYRVYWALVVAQPRVASVASLDQRAVNAARKASTEISSGNTAGAATPG